MAMRMREPERVERRSTEAAAPPPAHDLLALQRAAVHRAVGALLARAPETKEKPKEAEGTGATITVPDIGAIPLESFSFSTGSRHQPVPDLVLVSRQGEHSAKLQHALIKATAFDATITHRGLKIKLQKAIIASYSVAPSEGSGPPVETWTLAVEAVKHEPEAVPEEGATER